MVLILFELLVIGLLGLVAVWFGVRGRRVDDHPWCTRCRYDLFGLGPGTTCPECGSDLTKDHAVRVGRRKRLPTPIVVGLLIAASSFATGTVIAHQTDWTPHKPVWVLHLETGRTPAPQNAALDELLRRLNEGQLSPRQINRIADTGLRVQADWSIPWNPSWGDFIETAWFTGQLTDDRAEFYCRRAIEDSLTVQVRPKVRIGSSAPARLRMHRPARLSTGSASAGHLLIGEVLVETRETHPSREVMRVPFDQRRNISRLFDLNLDLPPGQHSFDILTRYRVYRSPSARRAFATAEDVGTLFNWTHVGTVAIEVVEADAAIIDRIADASLEEDILKTIQITHDWRLAPIDEPGVVFIHRPPINVSFGVYARHHGEEHRIAEIACSSDGTATSRVLMHPRAVFTEAETIDLVFRTDSGPAERTADLVEIWDGEVVRLGVPITGDVEATEQSPDV